MAILYDILKTPEIGWSRIDNSDLRIQYTGTWNKYSNSGYYNGSMQGTTGLNSKAIFYLYSSKLRIISCMNSDRPLLEDIIIDDNSYTFSEYNSSVKSQVIVYEKIDLVKTFHKVTLNNTVAGKYLNLDAIDLDDDGRFLTEAEFYRKHLIKTNSKYIGKNNTLYDLTTDLLSIDTNTEIIISEIDNVIKNINETYSIVKIV